MQTSTTTFNPTHRFFTTLDYFSKLQHISFKDVTSLNSEVIKQRVNLLHAENHKLMAF